MCLYSVVFTYENVRSKCRKYTRLVVSILINAQPYLCRQTGQSTAEELQSRDFRHELEEKEHQSRQKREREKGRSFTGEYCIPVVSVEARNRK